MDNVVSLDDLFHKRLFRVPDYQRGYSWEQRQVREFLEDLELLTFGRYHYTGTVVLHESRPEDQRMDKDGNVYLPVDIVDGQQRLTTIVLLLDGVRRSLASLSDSAQGLSQGILRNFISTDEMNGQRLFKLSLNADTDHFFKESILAEQPGVEGPQITSERRLAEAKQQIADYLSTNVHPQECAGEEWLRTLYAKLATQLRFTLYQVGDEAEVGVIFEVMNDRGKPLTDLEKVKNYLLHVSTSLAIPNDLAKSVNGAWAEILRQLMSAHLVSSDDEDQLLRAHWLTHYNPQSRQWERSRSIKRKFDLREFKDRHEELLSHLHTYAEGLRASCISFCDAYQPNRPDAFASFKANPKVRSQVVDWSAKLRRTGFVATFLPLLMAVRLGWPNDPTKYLEVLKLCEAFAFRVYRWNEYRSNAGQARLFRLGYDLATKNQTFGDTVEALKAELAYWCSVDDFEDETTPDSTFNWYRWAGLRYFLYEYEVALASEQGASPIATWDEIWNRDLQDTIEHVLPQTISDRPYWEGRFTTQEHQRYVHDLGNLSLTKHNSTYQNKPFPEKKGAVDAAGHCYAKSPLYLERELTQWYDWDADTIDERRLKLLEWGKKRWAVDASDPQYEGRAQDLIDNELDEDDGLFGDHDIVE